MQISFFARLWRSVDCAEQRLDGFYVGDLLCQSGFADLARAKRGERGILRRRFFSLGGDSSIRHTLYFRT